MAEYIRVPAFRGAQGDREYFQALIPNRVIADFFSIRFDEESEQRSQRDLVESHAAQIGRYLVDQRYDYVLGSLVYAVECDPVFLDDGEGVGVGTLILDAADRYCSIDGQHRHRGLELALEESEELGSDTTSVLIYVESAVDRWRQMFADMNGRAKRVTKNQSVSFDSRDIFARVARTIALEPPLRGHVEFHRASPGKGSPFWITLVSISEIAKALQFGYSKPKQVVRDDAHVLEYSRSFFSVVHGARSEIQAACAEGCDIESLRRRSILVSSTTMRALAQAIHACGQRDGASIDISEYAGRIASIDFSPDNPLWTEIGFLGQGLFTPQSRSQEVRSAANCLEKLLQ